MTLATQPCATLLSNRWPSFDSYPMCISSSVICAEDNVVPKRAAGRSAIHWRTATLRLVASLLGFILCSTGGAAPYLINSTIPIESTDEVCSSYQHYIENTEYHNSPFCRRIISSNDMFFSIPFERLNVEDASVYYTPLSILDRYPSTDKYDNNIQVIERREKEKTAILEKGGVKISRCCISDYFTALFPDYFVALAT